MAILPHLSGTLQGLEPRFSRGPVDPGNTVDVGYDLLIDTDRLDLADCIGHGVILRYRDAMQCLSCERTIRKAYGRAYCYDCFISLARTDLCFVSPDRCHFNAGTCREPSGAQASHATYGVSGQYQWPEDRNNPEGRNCGGGRTGRCNGHGGCSRAEPTGRRRHGSLF